MEVFGELEIIGIHTRVDARTRRKCARVQGGLYDAVWSSDEAEKSPSSNITQLLWVALLVVESNGEILEEGHEAERRVLLTVLRK